MEKLYGKYLPYIEKVLKGKNIIERYFSLLKILEHIGNKNKRHEFRKPELGKYYNQVSELAEGLRGRITLFDSSTTRKKFQKKNTPPSHDPFRIGEN